MPNIVHAALIMMGVGVAIFVLLVLGVLPFIATVKFAAYAGLILTAIGIASEPMQRRALQKN